MIVHCEWRISKSKMYYIITEVFNALKGYLNCEFLRWITLLSYGNIRSF